MNCILESNVGLTSSVDILKIVMPVAKRIPGLERFKKLTLPPTLFHLNANRLGGFLINLATLSASGNFTQPILPKPFDKHKMEVKSGSFPALLQFTGKALPTTLKILP